VIEIERLVKKYGEKTAVDGLTLRVPRGELFVLLGPNAAGKTTTLKVMAGLLKPTSGGVRIGGYSVAAQYVEAKKLLRYVPDFPFLYGKLTGMEFLEFVADLYGLSRPDLEERAAPMLEQFRIWNDRHTLIEDYSHGMKQKLIMTSTFLTRSPAIVIDEPMVGLDPASVRYFKQLLSEHARNGGAVFLSTHSLPVAEEIAHRIGILHRGRLIACGTLAELRQQSGGIHKLEELFLTLTEEGEVS
jgi:ABC-2 type transport system ATP-binding protein